MPTPEYRLNKYQKSGDWKRIKLSDILHEYNEKAKKGASYEHVSLTKDGVVPKTERYNRDFLVRDAEKEYRITHLDDICYNPANLKFGVICKNNYKDAIFSPIYVTFKIDSSYDPTFVEFLVTRPDFINYAIRYQEGTVYERMAVSPEDLLSIEVYVPTINEQKDLASLLCELQQLIEIKKNKTELIKQRKQAAADCIFADDNMKDWEKVKLSSVSKIFDGTHQTPNYTDNGVKFVSVENINSLYSTNKYISNEDYLANFKIKAIPGDVFMTRIGDVGTSALVSSEEDLAYYVSLALIKCDKSKLLGKYLHQYISTSGFQHELWKRTLHTAYPKKINKDEIGECEIRIPGLDKQEEIAGLLSYYDNLISSAEDELQKWEKIKAGVMQKIFVMEVHK